MEALPRRKMVRLCGVLILANPVSAFFDSRYAHHKSHMVIETKDVRSSRTASISRTIENVGNALFGSEKRNDNDDIYGNTAKATRTTTFRGTEGMGPNRPAFVRLRGGTVAAGNKQRKPTVVAIAPVAEAPPDGTGDAVSALANVRAGGQGTEVKDGKRGVSPRWPMLSAFLYFLAISFSIPVLPKIVNEIVSGSLEVTSASASLYGMISSTDAIFTLLTVNFHASMSDKFGRKPFLALSPLGLGIGFFITYSSRKFSMLLLASAIDGCTSSMYSLAQACITDCVGTGPALSQAFGLFQGLSLGMAFMLGLPLGGILGAEFGIRFPLLVSIGLCALNVLVTLVMPETLPKEKRKKEVDVKLANPLGALKMANRNKLVTGILTCWTLLWIAHVGLQINWINYTERKFKWGVAQSGASLALMGLLVGVFPKILIPRLGLERSITHGLLIYTVAQVVLGAAPGATNPYSKLGTPMVVAGLVLTSAGTIVFPAILAYLCNQVGGEEVGALQGTADTAKTVCSVLFGPAMTWIFGYYISDRAYPRQIEGASYYVGMVVAFSAWLAARHTFAKHGALDRLPPNKRTSEGSSGGVDDLETVES